METNSTNSNESSPDDCILIEQETKFNAKDFLNEWKKLDLSELIIQKDHFYEDPLLAQLRPHEAFVYTLGLNLALEHACDYYSTQTHESQLSISTENEKEFFEKIEENKKKVTKLNSAYKEISKCERTCPKCDFKSESILVIDQHLTQPHCNKNQYTCNFCKNYTTSIKQEYHEHVFIQHRRLYVHEKPAFPYQCLNCEFESREKFRFWKHTQNCTQTNETQSGTLLKPTKMDLFEYDEIFKRPYINQLVVTGKTQPLTIKNTPKTEFQVHVNKLKSQQSKSLTKICELLRKNDDRPVIDSKEPKLTSTICKPSTNVNKEITAPKYLICPICNGFLRNISDLKTHMQKIHKLDEKSTSAVINQKVMQQLNPITSKLNSTFQLKKPTIIKIVTNRTPHSLVDHQYESNMKVLVRAPTYEEELKEICAHLSLTKNEFRMKFVEVKTLAGKCFKCSNQTFCDLIKHFKSTHGTHLNNTISKFNCILCGNTFGNRERLVQHQLSAHFLVLFANHDKMFTYPKQQQQKFPIEPIKVTSAPLKSPSSTQKSYKCIECGIVYDEFFKYCTHLIKAHQTKMNMSKKLKCPVCKNNYSVAKTYQNHIKTHVKDCKVSLVNLNPIQKSRTKKFKSVNRRLVELLALKLTNKKQSTTVFEVTSNVIVLD